ncbi:LacI family DNA-binding transcriptional regulator [Microbacterium horticulturae]|uniref:LacI family DNA-binding transcriptional regulator n=1 Tax=Microbacterium horticulturae TaxID=3028316 RepID=A0ABY8C3M7_9MICO|nr:LacI family DNA-binding transcriptional regulator [Microbacterium sp. KACC 23027]WEG09448.1 LacI family DNA-binding transcriptional regulator [Microbacterium sp. KACC 23027]
MAEAWARREPSINDVAKVAGVSAQTVSRVANGKDVVRPATRDRVVAAMQQLGYRPNSAARALKAGRYRNIGVILFTLATYGNMRNLEAIADKATAAGYALTLIPLDAATQASVSGAFARLSEQAVDGIIIVIEAHLLHEADIELPTGLPVVVVDAGAPAARPVVDTDQAQGARLATEYLLDLGHATVWHIAGPEESYSAGQRRRSWEETLRARGAQVPEALRGDWSADSGYQAGLQLVHKSGVTAVFAANDQMALGALRAFHEHGVRVPDDISVVGFDDMPEAANFWPPLTTVHQDFETVGATAVSALIREIEGGAAESSLVATELIVRQSAAPYPDDERARRTQRSARTTPMPGVDRPSAAAKESAPSASDGRP